MRRGKEGQRTRLREEESEGRRGKKKESGGIRIFKETELEREKVEVDNKIDNR